MPNDAKKAIMASRASVISVALFGLLFVAIGIYNTWFLGRWNYTTGLTTIVFACVWSFYLYRLVRYPIVAFKNDTVEIIAYPISRTKRIALKDIKDIYRSWDHEAKILLVNDKKIHLPISIMKKTDYEFFINEIKIRRKGIMFPNG